VPKFKYLSKLQLVLNVVVAGSWLFAHTTSWLCAGAVVLASAVALGAVVKSAAAISRSAISHSDCDARRKTWFAIDAVFIAVCQWLLSLAVSWDIAYASAVVPYTLGYALGVMLVSGLLFKASQFVAADFEAAAIFA
jgi:hypothetical protein